VRVVLPQAAIALPDRSTIRKSNDPAIPGQVGCQRRQRHDGQE